MVVGWMGRMKRLKDRLGERERALRETTRKDYAESDDEEDDDEGGGKGCVDGDDDEVIAVRSMHSVKPEVVKEEEDEGEEAKWKGESKMKGLPPGEDLCTVFALSVRLEESPGLATKAYWGFNSRMEMVLVTPSGAATDTNADAGTGVKRRSEYDDQCGSSKKARLR